MREMALLKVVSSSGKLQKAKKLCKKYKYTVLDKTTKNMEKIRRSQARNPEKWNKHFDDGMVGGKLIETESDGDRFFDQDKLDLLRERQVDAVRYLDGIFERLFDSVPPNTYITITADHGELFGEEGYFGHGPINHEKVYEVPFVEGQLR